MAALRRLVRQLLPNPLLEWLTDFRSGQVPYRLLFVRRELLRAFRRPRSRDFSDVRSIVFVCYGNILRSPLAEALFRKQIENEGIEGVQVMSAGVNASTGQPADERGRASALDYGVSLDSHRSRLLTDEIVAAADVIVVMDRRNETTVILRFPGAAHKLVLLGSFLPPNTARSTFIADPYSGTIADVERCYRIIAMAVDGFVTRLARDRVALRRSGRLLLTSTAIQSDAQLTHRVDS